jgi:hypothetical protein
MPTIKDVPTVAVRLQTEIGTSAAAIEQAWYVNVYMFNG